MKAISDPGIADRQGTPTLVDADVLARLERIVGAAETRALIRKGMVTYGHYCDQLVPAPGAELDAVQALASAHMLKGSAGTLGLRAVAAAADFMEAALLRGEDGQGLVEAIRAAIDATADELLQMRVMQSS